MAPLRKVSALIAISLLASSAAADSAASPHLDSTLANPNLVQRSPAMRMRRHHHSLKSQHDKRLLGTLSGLGNDVGHIVGGLAGGLTGQGTFHDSSPAALYSSPDTAADDDRGHGYAPCHRLGSSRPSRIVARDDSGPASGLIPSLGLLDDRDRAPASSSSGPAASPGPVAAPSSSSSTAAGHRDRSSDPLNLISGSGLLDDLHRAPDPGSSSTDDRDPASDSTSGADHSPGPSQIQSHSDAVMEAGLHMKRSADEETDMQRRLVGSIFGLPGNNNNQPGSSSAPPPQSSQAPAPEPSSSHAAPAPSSSAQPSAPASQGGSKGGDHQGSTAGPSTTPSPSGGGSSSQPKGDTATAGNNNNNSGGNNGGGNSNNGGGSSATNGGNNANQSGGNGAASNSNGGGGGSNNNGANAASTNGGSGTNNAAEQQANAAAYSASAAAAVSAALSSTNTVAPDAGTTATLSDGAAPTSRGATATLRAAGTGVAANSESESGGGSSSTKIVVPIVVVAVLLALCAIGWTLYRRRARQNRYDPRLRSGEFDSWRRPAGGAAAGGAAAFAVGGASSGGFGANRGRGSEESFGSPRPMSSVTEETHDYYYDDAAGPPMQEVQAPVAFQAVGSAYGDGGAPPSSRMRNYGRSYQQRDSHAPSELSLADAAYVTDDGEGYYDGSSRVGYSSAAARGMDAAGAQHTGGRSYSPYADLQRAGSVSPEHDGSYDEYDGRQRGGYHGQAGSRAAADPFAG